MGTQICRRVEAAALGGRLNGLSANARVCLYVMALNARDSATELDPAYTYYRGWEHLSRAALGREDYDNRAQQAVARVVRELTDAGYIKVTGRRYGTRHGLAMYELVIP